MPNPIGSSRPPRECQAPRPHRTRSTKPKKRGTAIWPRPRSSLISAARALTFPRRHLEDGFWQVFDQTGRGAVAPANPMIASQDSLLAKRSLFEVSTLVPACPLAGFGPIILGRF